MSVRTRAVELRVEGVARATELGDRHARPGYEFVIVDTSWKNIIPLRLGDKTQQSPTAGFGLGAKRQAPDPANQSMEPTPYVVPALVNLFWLLSDGRFADPVDLAAQELVPNHLSTDRGSKRGQQGDEQCSHPARDRISLWPATATGTTRTEYSAGTGELCL
jgi:hypothetical protein